MTQPIIIERTYKAPSEVLFDAWVTPTVMRKWLFVGPHSSIVDMKLNLAVDGDFSIVEKEGSHTIDHTGHYMDIDCPDHLAFTLAVPDHFKGHTVVDIAFKPIEHGTRMVFQQTGVAPEVVVPGWEMMFDNLESVVE
jgi:uncharacterized protein YndB with AHSA1/START domain